MTLGIELSASSNYGRLLLRLRGLDERLVRAWGRGTDAAVATLRGGTVRLVQDRTTMDVTTAERITESSVSGAGHGRWVGRVGFTRPRPYTIRPRNKMALAFRWPARGPGPGSGGAWVFKSVRHPGARPYKLIPRAVNQQWPRVQAGYTREVEDVLRTFA